MIRISSALIVASCAAALAGCSASLIEAERAAPAGSSFDRALQKGYIALSDAEYNEADLVDTDAFAVRALKASRGERVLPEALSARKLPAESLDELARARARLIAVLDRGGRERAPEDAAAAQLRFDCWMQEQEENFQFDDIAACRDGFLAAVQKVETAMPALARSGPPALRATPAAATASNTVPKPRSFTVMFAFDSAVIDEAGRAEIAKAAAAYKEFGAAFVRIAGHADRAGPEPYNMKLGRARAEAVARALENLDVPRGTVLTRSYGETHPAVPTPDGRRESKNRRVEIGVDPTLPRTAIRQ